MNKRRIKIRQSEDLCWNERRILEALGSPFVVSYITSITGIIFVSVHLTSDAAAKLSVKSYG